MDILYGLHNSLEKPSLPDLFLHVLDKNSDEGRMLSIAVSNVYRASQHPCKVGQHPRLGRSCTSMATYVSTDSWQLKPNLFQKGRNLKPVIIYQIMFYWKTVNCSAMLLALEKHLQSEDLEEL